MSMQGNLGVRQTNPHPMYILYLFIKSTVDTTFFGLGIFTFNLNENRFFSKFLNKLMAFKNRLEVAFHGFRVAKWHM